MSYAKLGLLIAIMASTVASAGITYDADFWEGFDEEHPYEHAWLEVPDLIDNTTVYWWFNQTHHFLLGMERGLYSNDTLVLHEACFGRKFVVRVNWFAAMAKHGFWKNWIQEIAIIYQLYYMVTEHCTIDKAFNDIYLFCWNEGCLLN
jgi:hypothetical protein